MERGGQRPERKMGWLRLSLGDSRSQGRKCKCRPGRQRDRQSQTGRDRQRDRQGEKTEGQTEGQGETDRETDRRGWTGRQIGREAADTGIIRNRLRN